jgi:hypothetical protein
MLTLTSFAALGGSFTGVAVPYVRSTSAREPSSE